MLFVGDESPSRFGLLAQGTPHVADGRQHSCHRSRLFGPPAEIIRFASRPERPERKSQPRGWLFRFWLEPVRPKWEPVRVKKARQMQKLPPALIRASRKTPRPRRKRGFFHFKGDRHGMVRLGDCVRPNRGSDSVSLLVRQVAAQARSLEHRHGRIEL